VLVADELGTPRTGVLDLAGGTDLADTGDAHEGH
jgi:hypothetical protein